MDPSPRCCSLACFVERKAVDPAQRRQRQGCLGMPNMGALLAAWALLIQRLVARVVIRL